MRKVEFYHNGKILNREFDEDPSRAVALANSWLEDNHGHEAKVYSLFEREWHLLYQSKGFDAPLTRGTRNAQG